ncbi:hypothetical protein MPER_12131 [Moniliophthora perniciosa FA553]|nr:hypothetical protein MPER_12131 [Moniliophthora perniciosa FA553]
MVCGRWRDIALGTPALWSYIHFSFWGDDMELLPQHAGNRLVRKVQLLLNHSGNCPLDLTLDLFATDDWGTPAIPVYTEPIIDALVRHSHRWATLDLTAGQKVLSSASWLPISERLPLLRNLRFCPVRLNEDQQDLIVDFFGVCPVLNTCTSICGGRTALPWAQITAVELLEWKLDPIFQLLTPANAGTWKRLTLMLDVEVHQTVATGSIGSACLNMLNALTVEACLHTQIACGFDILTTPQLSSLEIRGCVSREFKDKFSSESWDGKPIAAFLKRSSCIITHLHLKWLPMTDKHAIFLLQQMPHIESLIIEECSRQVDDRRMNKIVVPSLLQKLLLDGSSPTERILPQLSSLELVVHVDVPIKLLAEVLKSRQHCLKLVDIKIIGKKGKRPPAEFRKFCGFPFPKTIGNEIEHWTLSS